MYEVALFGYAFGQHFYPFFRSGMAVYLLYPLMAVAGAWRIFSALLEQDEPVVMAAVKWFFGAFLVLMSLYNPATFSLAEKADLSGKQFGISYLETKKQLFGTDKGSMPYAAHLVDKYMTGWVQFSAELSDRRNRFLFPGSAQSALESLSKADSLADPQVRSILAQWQLIVVPYLMQNTALKDKLVAENLVAFLTYPVTSSSDVNDSEKVADRARRVVQILKAEPTLDLVSATRNLSAMLHDPRNRLSGSAMEVDASEMAVTAPMLGSYTLNAPVVSALAPAGFPESGAKAYNKGYAVLSSIANDARRQPLTSYSDFGELYEHIGFAVDVALARRQMQNADDVQIFGIACLNHGEDHCKQALVTAPTGMQKTSDGVDFSNKLLRAISGIARAPGAAVDQVSLEFAKVRIPLYIGIAKGIVTIATPFFLIFMLWPGRFLQGLTYILGGYVLVGLWMVSYVLWTYLVSDFMFGTGVSALKQAIGWSNAMGSYDTMVDALKIGYGALGTFCFLLVFGGMDKVNRSLGGAAPSKINAVVGGGVTKAAGGAVGKFVGNGASGVAPAARRFLSP